MEAGKENKEVGLSGSERMVVVGVRLDAPSKELLTWAMVKVAEPGDRVVALHVLTKSSLSLDPDEDSSASMISIVKEFDSMLSVYEGFCNLKQIDLKLKICRGSSIRKVLVQEAKGFGAAKLILGVSKCNPVIGSFCTSIAKFCARKLPKECWVAAVNNGKIVFQREAARISPLWSESNEQGSDNCKNLKALDGSSGKPVCLVSDESELSSCNNCQHNNLPSTSDSPKQSCSVCSERSDPALQGTDEVSAPLSPDHDGESSPSSVIPSAQTELLETRWALFRRIMNNKKTRTSGKTKSSIAQCGWQLPPQHSSSASVYSHQKLQKGYKNATGGAEEDETTIYTCSEEGISKVPKELESLHEKYTSKCKVFSYEELVNATSNFSSENLVGKGGSSHVYVGQFPDGRRLAIKLLKQSVDILKEFILEIEIVTSLNHKNIVSLVGFCFENHKLLFVYNFLARGSLEQNLHDMQGNMNGLGWTERCKIAVGVAEALNYLHTGCGSEPVIHRDVKSSNILISDDFEPQLSDFGLATRGSSSSSAHITCSDVAGTFGYLAPEYFVFGMVNEKIDVYAFGVVLLELLSGRKPIVEESPKGQQSLVTWVRPFLQSGISKKILDSSLDSKFDDDQLERIVLAASLCIGRSPNLRPKMAVILKLLRGDNKTMKWARSQIGTIEELEGMDEESVAYPAITDIQSHLRLALLDVEDDPFSTSSANHTIDRITSYSSLDAYLQERWSHSSSFV